MKSKAGWPESKAFMMMMTHPAYEEPPKPLLPEVQQARQAASAVVAKEEARLLKIQEEGEHEQAILRQFEEQRLTARRFEP